MNDDERRKWVMNWEPLYRAQQDFQRSGGGGLYAFVRKNRKEIDKEIERVLDRSRKGQSIYRSTSS